MAKGALTKRPVPQPAENERGVYVGGAAGEGEEEEHGVAGDDEEAAGEEPWEIVLEALHERAVDHCGKDEGNDVREQAHPRAEGLIRLNKLEIERDEVDRDERVGGGGSDLGEEDGYFFVNDVIDRKNTAGKRCLDGEGLLEAEDDEEDAGKDEERGYSRAVLGVYNAAEGDGHDSRDEGADLQEGTEVVDLPAEGEN